MPPGRSHDLLTRRRLPQHRAVTARTDAYDRVTVADTRHCCNRGQVLQPWHGREEEVIQLPETAAASRPSVSSSCSWVTSGKETFFSSSWSVTLPQS